MRTGMPTRLKLLTMLSGGGLAAPGVPSITAPTDASTVSSQTPTITVGAVAGATGYDFDVASDSSFVTIVSTVTNNASVSWVTGTLPNFNLLYVRARARNAAGTSAWSATVSFTPKVYLLLDQFTTNAVAPLASPRTAEPGPGTETLVQTGATKLSISSQQLQLPGSVTANSTYAYAGAQSRASGLASGGTLNRSGVTGIQPAVGWSNAPTNPNAAASWDTAVLATTADWGLLPSGITISLPISAGVDIRFIPILRATGSEIYAKMSGTWKLIWEENASAGASLNPEVYTRDTSATFDNWATAQLSAPFSTDFGTATLNVASPAVQDYVATADQVLYMTLTAPASITTEAGIIFRKTDASNYWRAYFTTAGAFKVDSVVAGVPTNRINIASVITGSGTRSIRLIMEGTLLDAFTVNAGTPTKRGAQVNVNLYTGNATVQPDIGAGWTAANLRSFPRICVASVANVLDAL